MNCEPVIAPGGCGFRPGAPLQIAAAAAPPVELPDIPGLDRMGRQQRAEAIRSTLASLPFEVSAAQITKKYGVPRGTAYDIARRDKRGSSRKAAA